MADAQNKPIQIVPDPQDRPTPAPAATERPPSRGRRAAGVLGLALIGSLAGNGFQYVEGDALQSELVQVTQDRATVTAERDALSVALAETQEELLQSRGALALVHSGLSSVRAQLRALEEMTAPLLGFETTAGVEAPIAPESVAVAPSDLAAVEPATQETQETTASEVDPAVADAEPAPAVPADAVPEGGETIATRPTESAWIATAEAEAVQAATAMQAEGVDDTVAAAVSTSVDSVSEELATAEAFVTEAVELVPASLPEGAKATE